MACIVILKQTKRKTLLFIWASLILSFCYVDMDQILSDPCYLRRKLLDQP